MRIYRHARCRLDGLSEGVENALLMYSCKGLGSTRSKFDRTSLPHQKRGLLKIVAALSDLATTRLRQIIRRLSGIKFSNSGGTQSFRMTGGDIADLQVHNLTASGQPSPDVGIDGGNPSPKIDIFGLGLHDIVLSGWFNKNTGELAPGFPVTAEDVVVDVGCGDGGIANFCARQGAHIILSDLDATKIQLAAERLAETPARKIETRLADANSLPLADCSVTRVICTEVLEHVDDPAAVVSELSRVGQPGALYLITVPGALSEQAQTGVALPMYFKKPNHIRIFEEGALKSLVEAAGLRVERQTSHGFFWAMWWLFAWEFWNPDLPMERQNLTHPLLEAWAITWSELLNTKNGTKIKHALDACVPKNQVIVARKPT